MQGLREIAVVVGGNMQNLQYAYLKTSACKLNENALQLYKRRNFFQGFFENWGI